MANQYKPTKQKKEKPAKAPKAEKQVKLGSAMSVKTNKPAKAPKPPKVPKAPKPEKPAKFGSAVKVKTNKPVKEPKQPKAPKPEKVNASAIKVGKVENAASLEKTNVLKKPLNLKVTVAVVVSLVVVIVLILTVVIPAIKRHGQQIKNISVLNMPDKIVYLVGEEANYDGLRVLVTRNNGETFTIRANQCKITGFDSSTPKQMVITVTYEGFITDFSIKVEEPPRQVPTLAGIHLDPLPKTEYKLGEHLDTFDGVIIREYVDGTTAKAMLLYSHVYGFDGITKPGKYTLIVRYIENGTIAETSYEITVTE